MRLRSRTRKKERGDLFYMFYDDRNTATKYIWSPLAVILLLILLLIAIDIYEGPLDMSVLDKIEVTPAAQQP